MDCFTHSSKGHLLDPMYIYQGMEEFTKLQKLHIRRSGLSAFCFLSAQISDLKTAIIR